MKIRLPIALILLCYAGSADTIELTNGRVLKGDLVGRVDRYIAIAQIEGRSAIERRVKVDEVQRIQFSDAFSKEEAVLASQSGSPLQAISLLEPLVKRRSAYLDLIPPAEQRLFALLLEAYIEVGREVDCLEQAKLWLPKTSEPKTRASIEILQIQAAWQIDRRDEAAFYATRWIESGKDAQETALPWNVLAANALEAGETETALWTALNPIVFSRPKRPDQLEWSYELAIVAARQLGRVAHAKRLLEEMRERDLAWPIESKWAAVAQELEMMDDPPTLSSQSNSTIESRGPNSLTRLVGRP